MDPRTNPYSPGAGTPPPELAGRDELLERASIALDRVRAGRSARSLILWGLRGVGKTVLLNRIRLDAEARGFISARIEAPEGKSLPASLAPALRAALLRLDRLEAVRAKAGDAMAALAGFVGALRLRYGDIEASMDVTGQRGLADSGDLELDLSDLISAVGEAAQARDTAVVLYVDELQYVPEDQLGALITAFHNASQQGLPITMVAAGLPQLVGRSGRAKSYAERLFEFAEIGKLDAAAATRALEAPALEHGVDYAPGAIDTILRQTQGYPYFLQEWGKHSWNVADGSPIERTDAEQATVDALAELDQSFFKVRLDRLTPSEKRYLTAMSELGPGPHRSGDIAEALGKPVASVAFVRNSLIEKGMIYSPGHGDTAFTVPLFDDFMRRTVLR
ncbi:ATP-binding protein [Brevundimonas sp.]|uniref:ATP-binding protein n=1 Tax=Brevundimonas sp. TaxID=1871086 RepID=UPI002E140F94|nr:ATP-binding protein [Brevundimonas sp.]